MFGVYQQGCTEQQSLFFKFDEDQTFSLYVPQHLTGVLQKQGYSRMEAGTLICKEPDSKLFRLCRPYCSAAQVLKPFFFFSGNAATDQYVSKLLMYCKNLLRTETEVAFKVHMSRNVIL